jgi:chromosome segregation ATPase
MTQATDQDIRELKSSIDGNTRAIDSLVKQTDANTRTIDSLVKQTDANTRSIDALAQGTAANTKAIADLVASMSGLREEMRVGFAQVDTKFAELEGRIDTKLAKLEGKIDVIDERTKLGFWGFIGRAVIVAMFTTLIAIAIRYVVTGKVL